MSLLKDMHALLEADSPPREGWPPLTAEVTHEVDEMRRGLRERAINYRKYMKQHGKDLDPRHMKLVEQYLKAGEKTADTLDDLGKAAEAVFALWKDAALGGTKMIKGANS
jgi:DNA-binding LacI/PurR family transcriptional regulator